MVTDLFRPVSLVLFTLSVTVTVNIAHGNTNCTYESKGKPTHYFDDYEEASYSASCGQLCPLPVGQSLLQVIDLKVFFPENLTFANCSWLIPGSRNDSLSTVMFFEQTKLSSLAHYVLCGEAAPSLSLWDEYSSGSDVQTSYDICRDTEENRPEAYSRKSSRLGNFDTLITLTDFEVQQGTELTLLKYITVDWSQDCFQEHKEIVVNRTQSSTTLASQWFTSNLRLPNEMQCRWKLTSPASPTEMIRVRVAVLGKTIPGSCVEDDYVEMGRDGSGEKERFLLCGDSHPFFFFSLTGSVYANFLSGAMHGAPEFEFTYSTLSTCPQDRPSVIADLVENGVWGMSDPNSGLGPCLWRVYTPWPNGYVVMLTRLDTEQYRQDCTGDDFLDVGLGSTSRRISLCGNASRAVPLWTDGQDLDVDLHHRPAGPRRTAGLFYKSVHRVPACQGIPGRLGAARDKLTSVLVELSRHRQHRDVSAPDCRWVVHPSTQMADADRYVSTVLVSDTGAGSHQQVLNSTAAVWLISGFRAYAGTAANASASLSADCSFSVRSVECQFLSTSSSLLLVYDPSLSTSPTPFDRVSLSFRQVEKTTSGQTGSVGRSWHARLLWLCVAAVVRMVLC